MNCDEIVNKDRFKVREAPQPDASILGDMYQFQPSGSAIFNKDDHIHLSSKVQLEELHRNVSRDFPLPNPMYIAPFNKIT